MLNFSEFIGESKRTNSAMERLYTKLFHQMRNELDRDVKFEYLVKLNAIAMHLSEQQVKKLVHRLK